MFCSNCGHENNDGAKFCQGCGSPMQQPAQPEQNQPVQPAQPEQNQPAQPAQQPAQPEQNQPAQQSAQQSAQTAQPATQPAQPAQQVQDQAQNQQPAQAQPQTQAPAANAQPQNQQQAPSQPQQQAAPQGQPQQAAPQGQPQQQAAPQGQPQQQAAPQGQPAQQQPPQNNAGGNTYNFSVNTSGDDNKDYGVIAYITWIGLVIALVCCKPGNPSRYHVNQALIAHIFIFALLFIPFVGWGFELVAVIFWLIGLIHAAQHVYKPIPLIGRITILK